MSSRNDASDFSSRVDAVFNGSALRMPGSDSPDGDVSDDSEYACRDSDVCRKADEGVKLFAAGKVEEGLACLREAIETSPASFVPRLAYGVVLLNTSQQSEAIKEFGRAVELTPDDAQMRSHVRNTLDSWSHEMVKKNYPNTAFLLHELSLRLPSDDDEFTESNSGSAFSEESNPEAAGIARARVDVDVDPSENEVDEEDKPETVEVARVIRSPISSKPNPPPRVAPSVDVRPAPKRTPSSKPSRLLRGLRPAARDPPFVETHSAKARDLLFMGPYPAKAEVPHLTEHHTLKAQVPQMTGPRPEKVQVPLIEPYPAKAQVSRLTGPHPAQARVPLLGPYPAKSQFPPFLGPQEAKIRVPLLPDPHPHPPPPSKARVPPLMNLRPRLPPAFAPAARFVVENYGNASGSWSPSPRHRARLGGQAPAVVRGSRATPHLTNLAAPSGPHHSLPPAPELGRRKPLLRTPGLLGDRPSPGVPVFPSSSLAPARSPENSNSPTPGSSVGGQTGEVRGSGRKRSTGGGGEACSPKKPCSEHTELERAKVLLALNVLKMCQSIL